MLALRPYQQDAVSAVYRHLREQENNPVVVIPTAGGKTPILATICRDAVQAWNGRVLVLSHVKELLEQAVDKLKQVCPELPVGVYSAGLNRRDTREQVIVAGIQSMYRRAGELDPFDLVIVDECFIEGTCISTPSGEVPIEQVQPGMTVLNANGIGKVVATSTRVVTDLIWLEFSNGCSIHCTPNHPIYTEKGWQSAGSLEVGSLAFGLEGMCMLRGRVPAVEQTLGKRQAESSEGTSVEAAAILFDFLLQNPQQLHERSERSREGEQDAQGYGACAGEARWQWPVDQTAGGNAENPGTTLGGGTRRLCTGISAQATAQTSQDRHRTPGTEDCSRTRRQQSPFAEPPNAGRSQVEIPGAKRLVRISHYKPPGGAVVFNLHVAGHPTYFANGILVHNCHLIPSDGEGMYRQFLAEARKASPHLRVIGLTATPFRLDAGPICGPENLLNAICYEIGVKELIVGGYLSPLMTKASRAKVDTASLPVRGGEFVADEVEQLMDADKLVEAACEEIITSTEKRNACLIFASGVKHGRHIARVLAEKHGAECGFVCGDTPAGERQELLARFRNQNENRLFDHPPLKYLCNVNVLTTGFDAPNIDCVVLLRPTMSAGLYYQMVGRGFRLFPGKQNCLVLDFGGNVLRHGPVDQIRTRNKSPRLGGDPPAKECPECRALIAIAYARCPDCGFEFPPPERKQQHDPQATNAGIISGQVFETTYTVKDTAYSVHTKKDAGDDAPRSLRVDYTIGWYARKSEWICVEHRGYARRKAEAWWRLRSPDPVPTSAEEAVALANSGSLAQTKQITVRAVAGDPYERIIDYELGPVPEPVAHSAFSFQPDEIPF